MEDAGCILLGEEGLPYPKSGIAAFKGQYLKAFYEDRAAYQAESRAGRRDGVRVQATACARSDDIAEYHPSVNAWVHSTVTRALMPSLHILVSPQKSHNKPKFD
jgi:hypothetical protein